MIGNGIVVVPQRIEYDADNSVRPKAGSRRRVTTEHQNGRRRQDRTRAQGTRLAMDRRVARHNIASSADGTDAGSNQDTRRPLRRAALEHAGPAALAILPFHRTPPPFTMCSTRDAPGTARSNVGTVRKSSRNGFRVSNARRVIVMLSTPDYPLHHRELTKTPAFGALPKEGPYRCARPSIVLSSNELR